jgi:DNA-directed RNA polymerase subunit RPC12/RpoP
LKLFDVGEVCPNCGKNAEIVDEHRECNYCGAIT